MRFILSLLLMAVAINSYGFFGSKKRTLNDGWQKTHYRKSADNTLKLGLIHYGNEMTEEQLIEISTLLTKRFSIATRNLIHIRIEAIDIIPVKLRNMDLSSLGIEHITDPIRLARVWHYSNNLGSADIAIESYVQTKNETDWDKYRNLDALLVLSELQFEGLGVAVQRILMTEYPMEIAWMGDQPSVKHPSKYEVVDELIHELGHFIGLGHAASSCETFECCETHHSANDVMSYCRDRSSVSADHQFNFEDCHINIIEREVVPRIRKGSRIELPRNLNCH